MLKNILLDNPFFYRFYVAPSNNYNEDLSLHSDYHKIYGDGPYHRFFLKILRNAGIFSLSLTTVIIVFNCHFVFNNSKYGYIGFIGGFTFFFIIGYGLSFKIDHQKYKSGLLIGVWGIYLVLYSILFIIYLVYVFVL